MPKIARILLGLFLILYALNRFFHIVPMSYGKMEEEARFFIDATATYLPYLYMFEALLGILLIGNKWVPFILIVLFPLTFSFLMFSIINQDLKDMWPALLVAALNVYLLIHYKRKYYPLFD